MPGWRTKPSPGIFHKVGDMAISNTEFQTPNTKSPAKNLELGGWSFFGIWRLVFGVWNLVFPPRATALPQRYLLGSFSRYIPGMIHVGIGYDVHRLVDGRKLILGGVDLHHSKGLEGHSDADVLMHAICDSILGALGEGDIGHFFPNSDPRWKNAPSKVFLQEAARQVSFHNGKIVNIDATLLAQAPKIAPHIHAMQLNISQALGINPRRVGIKATTNEQLGFLGREEGIAAMAVAGVDLPQ
jgi:2-C-methyl-D-erythritol 2,4-cyclodiphosphate synthase